MKANYSTYVTIAVVVIALVAVFSIKKCSDNQKSKDDAAQVIAAYQDSTHYWKNRFNDTVATRKVVTGSLETIGKLYSLEDVAKLVDAKISNLESYVRIMAKSYADLVPDTVTQVEYRPVLDYAGCPPQIRSMAKHFSNPYYDLNVRLGDSEYARVTHIDTLDIVTHRDYLRRFLRKEWYTSISVISKDTGARNELTGAFVVEDAKKNNSLDLFAEVGYNYSRFKGPYFNKPGVGAGLDLRLNRVSVSGTWLLVPGESKSIIEGKLRYSLIKL